MNTALDAAQLEKHIGDDINACEFLLKLLKQEREALQERNAETLADVVEKKIQPLTRLENSAKQRAQWLGAVGTDASAEGWQTLLNKLNREKLSSDWEKLKALTRECKQQNDVNGKILARHKQVFSRLLSLMRGQTAVPNLYTASGTASGGGSSNKVGEA